MVEGENGHVPYDKLIFGTEWTLFMIPMPGHDLVGEIAYRDLEDTQAMMAMRSGNRVVVIGGGLLGLEAAVGMAARSDGGPYHGPSDGTAAGSGGGVSFEEIP